MTVRWFPCGKPIVVPTATDAVQDGDSAADVGRPDADGRDVVLRRQTAARLDERVVELRTEQRMVDGLRDLCVGEVVERRGHRLT